MSRTHKHSKQKELKSRLQKRKLELNDSSSGMSIKIDSVCDHEIRKITSEFYRGNIRYGNKRHYEAYMKWKRRKAFRYKDRINKKLLIQ